MCRKHYPKETLLIILLGWLVGPPDSLALAHVKLSLQNSAGRIMRSDDVCQEQHNKIRLARVLASEIRLFKTFVKISKEASFARRPFLGGGPRLALPPLTEIRGAAPACHGKRQNTPLIMVSTQAMGMCKID